MHLLCSITFRTLTCRYSPLFAACSAVGHPPGLSCPNRSHYTGDRDSTAPGCRWPYRQPTPSRGPPAPAPACQGRSPASLGPSAWSEGQCAAASGPAGAGTRTRSRRHCPYRSYMPPPLRRALPSASTHSSGAPRRRPSGETRVQHATKCRGRRRRPRQRRLRGRQARASSPAPAACLPTFNTVSLTSSFPSNTPSVPSPAAFAAQLESGYRQFPRTGHAGGPQNPLVRWPRCTRKSAGSTRWTSPRGTGRRREVRLRLRRVRCVRACAALGSAVCGKGVCAQCARSAHAPCTRAAVAWAELGGASRERESAPPTRARR